MLKEWRLLCEFVFNPFEKRTLIQKMAQREALLMKPKHRFGYPSVKIEIVVPNH